MTAQPDDGSCQKCGSLNVDYSEVETGGGWYGIGTLEQHRCEDCGHRRSIFYEHEEGSVEYEDRVERL